MHATFLQTDYGNPTETLSKHLYECCITLYNAKTDSLAPEPDSLGSCCKVLESQLHLGGLLILSSQNSCRYEPGAKANVPL